MPGHDSSGSCISGEEGLDDQLGDRDIERRAEGSEGSREGQFLPIVTNAERDDEVTGTVNVGLSLRLLTRVGAQLLVECPKLGIRGKSHLAAQTAQEVSAPFTEVDDAPRHAVRVQTRPQDVRRGREQ